MKLKSDYFPRLLVITDNAWSDKIASGNTISNHLGGWDKTKLSNLFLRNEEIDNDCCETYFKISEKEIVYSFLCNKDLGVDVKYEKEFKTQPISKITKLSRIKSFIIRIRPFTILFLRELFWRI